MKNNNISQTEYFYSVSEYIFFYHDEDGLFGDIISNKKEFKDQNLFRSRLAASEYLERRMKEISKDFGIGHSDMKYRTILNFGAHIEWQLNLERINSNGNHNIYELIDDYDIDLITGLSIESDILLEWQKNQLEEVQELSMEND